MFKSFFRAASHKEGQRSLFGSRKSRISRITLFVGVSAIGATTFWLSSNAKAEDKKLALDPKEWREFPLTKKTVVSRDSAVYSFELPSPEHELAMPTASFVLCTADLPGEDKPVVRPYTPISTDEKGHFDLLVKSYPNGKLSKYIGELPVGGKLKVKGPIPKIQYTPNMKKHIGMIAGGSGITPMLQVINEVIKNPEDKTQVTLLFGNLTPEDILLKEQLDKITKDHSNIKVHYVVDKADSAWTGDVGYINDDLVKKYFPAPSSDSMVFVCGPPGLVESISGGKTPDFKQGELKGVLKRVGYTEEQVFKF